jgi:hypothetical protein
MIWRAHFAPTELWLVSYFSSYKRSVPPELKPFACGRASMVRVMLDAQTDQPLIEKPHLRRAPAYNPKRRRRFALPAH